MSALKSKFSGWQVLVACAISSGFQQAFILTASLFVSYIAEDLGTTSAVVLYRTSIVNLVGMLLNMFFAKPIYAKLGTKKSFFIGSLCAAAGYLISATCQSVGMLMVSGFIQGFALCIGMQTFTTACITKWFYTGRKTTSAVMMAAIPGATTVAMLVTGELLAAYDWRTVYFILAGIVIVTGCGSALFVHDSPESVGQKMYGYDKFLEDQKNGSLNPVKEEPSIGPEDARKTSFYWLLIITVFSLALLSTSLGVYAPVYWKGEGMDILTASRLSSVISILTLAYVVGTGALSDRFGINKVAPVLYAIGIVGVIGIVLLGGTANPLAIAACCVVATLTRGVNLSYYTMVLPQAFGPKYLGKISGVFLALYGVTGFLNPIFFGKLAEVAGFEITWFSQIALGAVGVVLMVILGKKIPAVHERTVQIYMEKEGSAEK